MCCRPIALVPGRRVLRIARRIVQHVGVTAPSLARIDAAPTSRTSGAGARLRHDHDSALLRLAAANRAHGGAIDNDALQASHGNRDYRGAIAGAWRACRIYAMSISAYTG